MRRYLFPLCWLLCWLLAPPALALAHPEHEYWRADFALVDSPTPPAANDPRWHPVSLPHALKREDANSTGGWFRFRMHSQAVPATPQALYVWWLNLNAAFYFNGAFLGDGGRFDEPIARNWNTPFLYLLPRDSWRVGDNEILIRIKSDPGWGVLSPIEIGPFDQLRQDYERRRFLQFSLTRGLTLTLLLAAALVLAVWWRRRHDPQYLWFGLACLMWTLFSYYLVVRDPPLPGPLLRTLAHYAMDVWVVCLALFVQHYLGQRNRRLERLLLAYLALAAGLNLWPGLWPGYAYLANHGLGFLILCGLAWQIVQRWRQSQWREHYLLAVTLGALVLSGLHDLLVGVPYDWLPPELARIRLKYHFVSMHLAAPVVLLFLTGHLGRRFAEALGRAESFNRELEARVAASANALAASYQSRAQLERETAAAEERERIYRDLHDDIGAKLLSLAIRAKTPEDTDIARSALRDLRDVVSRSARADAPLGELLADWRAEIVGRCAAAHVELVWNQPEDLPERDLTAAEALNLGRILREAVSNVLRHAGARALVVGVRFVDGRYRISLDDDGNGKPRAPGRGMRNMRARAGQLGGEIEWTWEESGCRVLLSVPGDAAATTD